MYCKKIGDLGVFDGKMPNHVLVNEYHPGQGILVRFYLKEDCVQKY